MYCGASFLATILPHGACPCSWYAKPLSAVLLEVDTGGGEHGSGSPVPPGSVPLREECLGRLRFTHWSTAAALGRGSLFARKRAAPPLRCRARQASTSRCS